MATHGFIEFNFDNESKDKRTLVHAVHDGYVGEMMKDILSLPFHIYYSLKKNYLMEKNVPAFLNNCNYNHSNYIYTMFSKDEYKSYSQMESMWYSLIPLDSTRYSLPSYLIAIRPDMYQIAKEPYILYGGEVEDADIKITFTDNRLCTAIIHLDFNDEDTYYLDIITDINNFIIEKDAKIIIKKDNDKKIIIINYDKILIDLLYNKNI